MEAAHFIVPGIIVDQLDGFFIADKFLFRQKIFEFIEDGSLKEPDRVSKLDAESSKRNLVNFC